MKSQQTKDLEMERHQLDCCPTDDYEYRKTVALANIAVQLSRLNDFMEDQKVPVL